MSAIATRTLAVETPVGRFTVVATHVRRAGYWDWTVERGERVVAHSGKHHAVTAADALKRGKRWVTGDRALREGR